MKLTLCLPYSRFDLILLDERLLLAPRHRRRERRKGRSMHSRTSSQKITKRLAYAQLIEPLYILLREVRVHLGSEVHLAAVKRYWLWP